ncbi:hypothetical protein C7E16_06025 [Acinetobacter radioresistens]|uniref:hypothetical protein n=2 Tax=Acinetobacter TaxID=469 RepID=UPI0009461829|nr:hypothetical protein [Acinetobacter radioresistens]MCU4594418.1 hypothetical protein [Acinetobacter radioresistens]PSD36950.1 hypothetical protein C7E16_06025 [Acinetobacter radioresistens]PSD38593.1 hypothetical protein C7E21_08390 [Acinetobacter radioresistens]WGX72605.1 hypothetical protein QJS67_10210 [Acinetobacter radioresistens]
MPVTVQKNNSNLLWFIAGVITAIIVMIALYFWLLQDQSPAVSQPVEVKQSTSKPMNAVPSDQSEPQQAKQGPSLVDDQLLNEPVHPAPALAKEEIAKLDDIQNQLKQQQALLQEQHASADKLIQLKEEQIKLLEAQLAQQPSS